MKVRFLIPMLVASSMMLAAFAPAQKADDKKPAKPAMAGKMGGKMAGGKMAGKSKMSPEQKAAWDKAHPRDAKGRFIKKADAGKKPGPARDAKGRFIKKDAKPGAKPAMKPAEKPKMKMGEKMKAGMDKMKAKMKDKMKGGDKK